MATRAGSNIDDIDSILDMITAMNALGIPCKGLRTLDELKNRVKEVLDTSKDSAWSPGQAFSVFSEAKEEESRKMKELIRFYSETLHCVKRLDGAILSLLKQNIGAEPIQTMENRQLQLQKKGYFVLVAGETSAGKSSLLNLILGEELLPYSILSTTSTICELKYGKDRRIVAHFKDKDPETGCPTKAFPLSDPQGACKDTYLAQIAKFVHVKSDRDKGSAFKKVELFWPHVALMSGIVIVDSPGIGESEIMDAIVTDYLPEAFAFIYVINSVNAGGVQKDRLQKLLEKARKVILEQQGSFSSKCALFVCNKWDQVSENEIDEVKSHVIKKLSQCWPRLDPDSQVTFMSTSKASTAQAYGLVTAEFTSLMDRISSMIFVTIQTRLEVHWKWLDYILSRIAYHTRAFIRTATTERSKVIQKMNAVTDRLNVIEKQQKSVIEELHQYLKGKSDEAVRDLSKYLTSRDVTVRFASWTLDDVPRGDASWEVTKHEIFRTLEQRLREFIEEWEEENHVFADARLSLIQHFIQRYNFVEGQLQNLETSIAFDEEKVLLTASSSVEINFTTAEKVIIGATSPIWVSFGLVALVISSPFIGVMAIKEKLEDRRKILKYQKDKCAFMADASKMYLKEVTDERSLQLYIKDQLKEATVCLKQIEARIPELIKADKLLCQQLINETRSQKVDGVYYSLMTESSSLRGRLAAFGIKDVNGTGISSDELEWKEDSSSFLGSGAFAVVYRGKLKMDGKDQMVALKVWKEALSDSNACLFMAEVETLRKLDHPHIVKCYGTALLQEENNLRPVLVMEICRKNLKSHIFGDPINVPAKSQNAAAVMNVIQWASQIAVALAFMHKQGIVHRDLKLENILLSDDYRVKVTDVGVAKEIKLITGTLTGTPLYMAPEVINSGVYDNKIDIFSFGIILWEMWHGKRAYYVYDEDVRGFLERIAQGLRPSHIEDVKAPPHRLQQLMEQCWAGNPVHRPTAQKCYEELGEFNDSNAFEQVSVPRECLG